MMVSKINNRILKDCLVSLLVVLVCCSKVLDSSPLKRYCDVYNPFCRCPQYNNGCYECPASCQTGNHSSVASTSEQISFSNFDPGELPTHAASGDTTSRPDNDRSSTSNAPGYGSAGGDLVCPLISNCPPSMIAIDANDCPYCSTSVAGPIKLQDGSIIIDAEQDPDALPGHLADVCEDEDDFNSMDETFMEHMFSDSFAARRIDSTVPFKRGLHSFEVSARIAENVQELYDLRQHDVSSLDRAPMQIFKGSNEDTSVSLPIFPRRVFHRGESSVERAYFERMQIAHVTICNESNGDETSTADTRNTNLHTRYSMQHLDSRSRTPTAMSDCEDAEIVEGNEEDTTREEPEEDEVALYETHNSVGAYEEYIDENNSVVDDLYFAHHGHHIEFDLISVSDFGNNSIIDELSESHIMISPKLFEQLAKLPTKQYELSELHQENACQICMEIYQSGDVLKTLPCFHDYHDACIDEWLKENITCPICRTVIECLEGDDEQTDEYVMSI